MLNVSELKTTGNIDLYGDLNFYTSPTTAVKFSFPTENITYSFPPLPEVNSVLLINPDGSITYSSTWKFAKTVDDQSIGGVKTFTSIPILPASDPTNANHAVRKAYVDSLNAENLNLTSNQTVTGVKTFAILPLLPQNPVSANEAARKAYVDTKVSLTGSQTINGTKTFSVNPISTAAQSTNSDALTKRSYVDTLDAANVKLTGNQDIDGTKTFIVNPISTADQSTNSDALTKKSYVDLLNAQNVKLTGDQTIYGVKVFSNIPYLPPSDPIYENHAVRKKYVDARTSNLAFSSTKEVTSNTNVLPGDNGKTFFANTGSGNININLPLSTNVSNGFIITCIKTAGANTMKVNASSTNKIGNISTLTYTEKFSSVTLILYGQKWYVQSHFNGTLIQ